jgi:hypothetical protein
MFAQSECRNIPQSQVPDLNVPYVQKVFKDRQENV